MKILNDQQKLRKLDPSSILASAGLLPDQIEQAWEEVFNLKLPATPGVDKIIVAGMGGSALGARIIDSLSFEILKVPLEIVKGYHLPAYVDPKTLAIISSYSGNTQETISCCHEALKRNCQILVISSGGKLAQIVQEKKLAAYVFQPLYNPSGQPRMGLGYSIAAQLALLTKLGLLKLDDAQMTAVVNYLKKIKSQISVEIRLDQNQAKKLAADFENKIMVVVASEHLIGASHAFKNMINENSKNFAVRFSIPEMNHHLLEALLKPEENQKMIKFLFLDSEIYDPEIKKRMKITQKVVTKNGLSFEILKLKGKTRLIQVFETICYGSFISCYLAFLYGLDPAPIPWVDFFKKELTVHEKKR